MPRIMLGDLIPNRHESWHDDDNPADWTLRAIYADWLEEQEHANSRVTLGTYAHAIPQRQAEAVAKIERMYG